MEQTFETEVLTRLAVIENKLDDYKDIKNKTDNTDKKAIQNEQDIKELKKEVSEIKDNNKWAFRTSIGAIITAVVGLVFVFIKIGLGVG